MIHSYAIKFAFAQKILLFIIALVILLLAVVFALYFGNTIEIVNWQLKMYKNFELNITNASSTVVFLFAFYFVINKASNTTIIIKDGDDTKVIMIKSMKVK